MRQPRLCFKTTYSPPPHTTIAIAPVSARTCGRHAAAEGILLVKKLWANPQLFVFKVLETAVLIFPQIGHSNSLHRETPIQPSNYELINRFSGKQSNTVGKNGKIMANMGKQNKDIGHIMKSKKRPESPLVSFTTSCRLHYIFI